MHACHRRGNSYVYVIREIVFRLASDLLNLCRSWTSWRMHVKVCYSTSGNMTSVLPQCNDLTSEGSVLRLFLWGCESSFTVTFTSMLSNQSRSHGYGLPITAA